MSPGLLIIASVVAVLIIITRILQSSCPKGLLSLSRLPRPNEGSLIVGQLMSVLSLKFHAQLLTWTNTLGSMYTFRIFNKTILVVTDLATFQSITGSGDSALPRAGIIRDATRDLGPDPHSMFTRPDFHDETFKVERKVLSVAFSMDNVRSVFPTARTMAQALAAQWTQGVEVEAGGAFGSAVAVADSIVVSDDVMILTLEIFLKGVLKMDMDAAGTALFLKNVNQVLEEVTMRILNPLRQAAYESLFFMPWSRQLRAKIHSLYGTWRQVLQHCRDGGPYDDGDLSLPACVWRLEHEYGHSADQTCSNIGALVIAGFETNAGTITWALYDIASHPSVQKTLAEELRAAGLLQVEGGKARDVKWEDLTALPYFSAVLKESMRLHSVVASTSAIREADRDVAIAGYHVPKGTIVWAPLNCMHNSVHNWEDPMAFNPQRWLVEPGGLKAGERPFLPFAYGPRSCIGQNLANMTVRTVLLELVSALWFEVPSSMGSPEEVHKRQLVELTLKVDGGMRLQARPHRH